MYSRQANGGRNINGKTSSVIEKNPPNARTGLGNDTGNGVLHSHQRDRSCLCGIRISHEIPFDGARRMPNTI